MDEEKIYGSEELDVEKAPSFRDEPTLREIRNYIKIACNRSTKRSDEAERDFIVDECLRWVWGVALATFDCAFEEVACEDDPSNIIRKNLNEAQEVWPMIDDAFIPFHELD